MKTILLWDPRFPDRRSRRLSVADRVAFAAVRAGVAAAADPADAGALELGALALPPIAATPAMEIALVHGSRNTIERVTLPEGVGAIAIADGFGAAVPMLPAIATVPGAASPPLMFAATRFGINVGRTAPAVAANRFFATRRTFATPNWNVENAQFLFWNGSIRGGAAQGAGNPVTIEKDGVRVGSTTIPLTYGGAQGFVIPDDGLVLSDPLTTVLPANGVFAYLAAGNVQAGQSYVGQTDYILQNGDGIAAGSTSRAALVDSGAVGQGFSAGAHWSPIAMFGTGWDGSPVVLVLGDSVPAGQVEPYMMADARGNRGFVSKMLDDPGRRLAHANYSVNGLRTDQVAAIMVPFLRRIVAMLPDAPWTHVLLSLGLNDLLQDSDMATLQLRYDALRRDLQGIRVDTPVHPMTITPDTDKTGNFWADEVGQGYFSTRFGPAPSDWSRFNGWLRGKPAGFAPAIDVAIAVTGTTGDKWKVIPFNGRLTAAVPTDNFRPNGVAGPTQVQMDVAPPLGAMLAFGVGSASQDGGYYVAGVSGSGPFTVSLLRGQFQPPQIGAPAINKAQPLGTSVTAYLTTDGLHPGGYGHDLLRRQAIEEKTKIQ